MNPKKELLRSLWVSPNGNLRSPKTEMGAATSKAVSQAFVRSSTWAP